MMEIYPKSMEKFQSELGGTPQDPSVLNTQFYTYLDSEYFYHVTTIDGLGYVKKEGLVPKALREGGSKELQTGSTVAADAEKKAAFCNGTISQAIAKIRSKKISDEEILLNRQPDVIITFGDIIKIDDLIRITEQEDISISNYIKTFKPSKVSDQKHVPNIVSGGRRKKEDGSIETAIEKMNREKGEKEAAKRARNEFAANFTKEEFSDHFLYKLGKFSSESRSAFEAYQCSLHNYFFTKHNADSCYQDYLKKIALSQRVVLRVKASEIAKTDLVEDRAEFRAVRTKKKIDARLIEVFHPSTKQTDSKEGSDQFLVESEREKPANWINIV